jgi:hypothetical protein
MSVALRFPTFLLTGALCALALAGCSTTQVDATWLNPAFAGRKLEGPVLVVGVARDATVRRLYEDEMVAALKARGIAASPSYLAATAPLDERAADPLLAAARAQGARYVVSSALIDRQTETRVVQTATPAWGVSGFSGWYGAWYGFSVPVRTDVQTFTTLIGETAVTQAANGQVEWTARTSTNPPRSAERGTQDFVAAIIAAMQRAGLVGAAP